MSNLLFSLCYIFNGKYVDIYNIEMSELKNYRDTDSHVLFELKNTWVNNSLFEYKDVFKNGNSYIIPKSKIIFNKLII